MIRSMQFLIVLTSIFFLSACSFLSPVKMTPPTKYLLTKTPGMPHYKTHSKVILVAIPDTRPIFNTTRMAYTISRYQVSYFSQNEWAETPAQMLQPLLVKTLESTHYFKAVVTPPYAGKYDYTLDTEILSLQQDFTHKPATLALIIRAQLIKMSNSKLLGSKVFCVEMPMPYANPYAGVYAANLATAVILREIADFSLNKIK